MRNKYPGICYYCGKLVAKGQGHFELLNRHTLREWRTIHANCVLKQREEKKLPSLYKREPIKKLTEQSQNQGRD